MSLLPEHRDADAAAAAALLAVDPQGLGGAALRAASGTARDAWLQQLRRTLPEGTPVRRVPLTIQDAALLGSLDLAASLSAGRAIAQRGLLAQADGGLLILPMAERLSAGLAARLAAVLDTHAVVLERDGLTQSYPARWGLVALDEGLGDDEPLPAALLDRLAFHLQIDPQGELEGELQTDAQSATQQGTGFLLPDCAEVAAARAALPQVSVPADLLQALVAAAQALGVGSLRAPLLALRAARAAAALAGAAEVNQDHAALAARLVLAPRATQLPVVQTDEAPAQTPGQPPDTAPGTVPDPAPDAAQEDPPPPTEPPPAGANAPHPEVNDQAEEASNDTERAPPDDAAVQGSLAEQVLAAAKAAIPAGLLAKLAGPQAAGQGRAPSAGRAGAVQKNPVRGRPMGARRGEPRAGARLNVLETLRAAAPWQLLRQREAQALAAARQTGSATATAMASSKAQTTGAQPAPPLQPRIQVRREDFHVTRFKQVGGTTTVFVVDASGSSALHRLSEAKGAVELLLADCYVRRDRVAVLAFRGKTAELLLPPTRSLARAKRSLAALPGGGGTPLAAALQAALGLVDQIQRQGELPVVVLLTDGRANIASDGTPGRLRANEDALAAARRMRQSGVTTLLLDTSPQPQLTAELLAQAMGAAYVPLPYAGAQQLSQAVRLAARPLAVQR